VTVKVFLFQIKLCSSELSIHQRTMFIL